MVTVIWKSSRIKHSLKYWGGLLNPNKQYYTLKREAKTLKEIQKALAH